MEKGFVQIYYGDGKGKTTAALGRGILAASKGKSVIIIQFLKGKNAEEISFIKRLEPEIKVFRFEKMDKSYNELTNVEKDEEIMNIKNGLNFAKKVLATGEYDVVILDEVLGTLEQGIITSGELQMLMESKDDDISLIMTGRILCDELVPLVDEIYKIETIKNENSVM